MNAADVPSRRAPRGPTRRARTLRLCAGAMWAASLGACGGGDATSPGEDARQDAGADTDADASTPEGDASAGARDADAPGLDLGVAPSDADVGPPDGSPDDGCADAPVESYETFGRGVRLTWCAGCHAATTPERFGAPDDVVFDTRQDVRDLRARILARAAFEPVTMPPAGGTSALDRERLRVWLTCFEPD